MKTIVRVTFGSHLYGTANEQSDKDFKGVFLPTKEQIFLNKIPKSITSNTKKDGNTKNTSNDVDTEVYSLHYFIHLACEGETVALDMLHAPDDMLVETSAIWKDIVANRYRFYTKNLKAFIGYARRQAAKYGVKGSRLNDAKRVLDFSNLPPSLHLKVKDVWDFWPVGEHIFKHEPDSNGVRMYEVCGRKIPETATVEYLTTVVQRFYDNYGERARQAATNKGVDWKAVSHAFRAAFQVKQILTENTITFPLKEANYLREIKEGKLDYQTKVAPELDRLMDEVEGLSLKSNLPMSVDRAFWDKFIIEKVEHDIHSRKY